MKPLIRTSFVLGLLFCPVSSMAITPIPPHPISSEKSDLPTFFTLPNGVKIVVIEDHRTPTVTHMAWYTVGAADEAVGESGLAHFFEHLMFKGTPRYPDAIFSKDIARMGGTDNAFTTSDYTAYYQRVPKDKLSTVMDMEADRMTHLTLTDAVVTTERNVVREERRMRFDNAPSAQLYEQMMAALYRNHPYGRPVIGWDHEIEALNKEAALSFYKKNYAPNQVIVVVAGDVTPDEVKELAEKTYGVIPAVLETRPDRVRPKEPPQNVERRLVLKDEKVTVPMFSRIYAVPSVKTADKGQAETLEIMAYLLGEGSNSQLYQNLVVKQKIATSVSSTYSGDSYDTGRFSVGGIPAQGTSLEVLEQAIDKELETFKSTLQKEEDLNRAKKAYQAAKIFAKDSQVSEAHLYGTGLVLGLSVEQIAGFPERLKDVNSADLKEMAAKFLVPTASVTGYLEKE